MTKQDMIKAVMFVTAVSEQVAREHLEAEEWDVDEAIVDIDAERKAGLL